MRVSYESHHDDVARALTAWNERESRLLVPSLFWAEVLNALHRRHGWTAARVAEGLMTLDGLEITTVEVDRPLLLLAASQMDAFGLTSYDALYLALALTVDGRLATFDDRLAQAAGDRAVPLGPGGRSIAEPVADRPILTTG